MAEPDVLQLADRALPRAVGGIAPEHLSMTVPANLGTRTGPSSRRSAS